MTNTDICKRMKILEALGFTNININTHTEEITFDATSPEGMRYLNMSLDILDSNNVGELVLRLPYSKACSSGPDIAGARKVMREAFEKDTEPGGLKHGYISNIAMLLHDRYGITNYETRNEAAKDILKLIFWDK